MFQWWLTKWAIGELFAGLSLIQVNNSSWVSTAWCTSSSSKPSSNSSRLILEKSIGSFFHSISIIPLRFSLVLRSPGIFNDAMLILLLSSLVPSIPQYCTTFFPAFLFTLVDAVFPCVMSFEEDDNRDDIFSVNFVSSAVSSRNLAVQCFEDFSSSPFSTICRFCIKIPSFEILFNARSIL